ncbi:hypothetical protein FACS1894172_21140 [Spirochaetia bacterium]|nr:hypothetical protein FACS1894172_21140 [Spirochaetia bacterium]
MEYQCDDIEALFERAGYGMINADHPYVVSSMKDGLTFFLTVGESEIAFCWQRLEDKEALLSGKLSGVQQLYPGARVEPGKIKPVCTRLYIPLDQSKPLADALEVVEKTKAIVGY